MYSTAHALINPSLCLAPFRELRTNHSAISSHLIVHHLMVLFFQHGANICNIKSILSRGPLESERWDKLKSSWPHNDKKQTISYRVTLRVCRWNQCPWCGQDRFDRESQILVLVWFLGTGDSDLCRYGDISRDFVIGNISRQTNEVWYWRHVREGESCGRCFAYFWCYWVFYIVIDIVYLNLFTHLFDMRIGNV